MAYAAPVAWEQDSRGFWTQRKRSATSLAAVLALLAGLAVGFKLFDRGVPNNVVRDASLFEFEVWKRDSDLGETSYSNTADDTPIFEPGVNNFPGDTRTVDVKIANVHEQRECLDLQNRAMDHLAARAPTLAVPRVCPPPQR